MNGGKVKVERQAPRPAAVAVARALGGQPARPMERRTLIRRGKPFATGYGRGR